MNRLSPSAALVGLALLVGCRGPAPSAPPRPIDAEIAADGWTLYAIEYARSEPILAKRLVRGAGAGDLVDMSWYFYAAVGQDRVALIDAGTDVFARAPDGEMAQQWSIARSRTPTEALALLALTPDDVTDVVLTHRHWDHVDGIAELPRARIHAPAGEWPAIRARKRLGAAIDALDADDQALALEGSDREGGAAPIPGWTARESGRHTEHAAVVELTCGGAPVVIAGDAAYLFRNIEEGRPITATRDAPGNRADVIALRDRIGAAVLPGHDPAVFARYPSGIEGVARICGPGLAPDRRDLVDRGGVDADQ